MKFLHLADLHLGKRLNDVSLLEDQAYILHQITEIAVEQAVDGVLIAGDIYQKSSPQAEAVALWSEFVTALVQKGKKLFVISGNHDSDRRISFFSQIVKQSGVYVSEKFDGMLQQVSLQDDFGEIIIHLLPFIKPIHVRNCYPEEKIESCQQAMESVLRHSPIDKTKRNILLCHQFVIGAEHSDSEEQMIGCLENVDASLFEAFDYVALGHIHKPQKVGRDTLRYAGSPLKYSFSEVHHQKSVCLIDLREKGTFTMEKIPLSPLRDLREVKGELCGIMEMPYSEDYIHVILKDEIIPPDVVVTLSTVFPNLMKITVENSKTSDSMDVSGADVIEEKGILELFSDFYRLQNNDRVPGEEHLKIMKQLLEQLGEGD